MPKFELFILSMLVCFFACTTKKEPVEQVRNPNIIYILADDLGYGDLSSYGQTNFSTPHIDMLAAEGIRFTQHYSGSTVCAPSRSSLMTGLHTGHTPVRGNKEWQPEGQWPLPKSTYTLAEMLKDRGYVTGAFGKWGLGYPGSEGDPNHQGFDEFFGFNCQRIAHHYYPYHLWHNQQKVMLNENVDGQKGVYAPELMHQKALQFIENHQDTTFFMFYPSALPHAELLAPESYMQKYRGKFLPEKAYQGVDEGPAFNTGPYRSQAESHAAFAAMISYLDDQVGEIVAKLRELGLDKNTLIMFSSDNGPHLEGGADPDYFDSSGMFRGYKRDLYEGGIRVPMIARWPAVIAPGTQTDHVSAFWDVVPTVAEIVGAPQPQHIDGISFLPTLKGESQPEHRYLYWEFHEKGGRQALRSGNWKLVRYNVNLQPQGEYELYNLQADPSEENNLAGEQSLLLDSLRMVMQEARTESDVFQFASDTL